MATINDANLKPLKDVMTCAICLDYYRDPRILPCSHTLCFKCIQKLVTDGKVTCPLGDNMIMNENDIDQLPINRTARDMIDFVLSINPSFEKKTYYPCENCNEKEAINWCEKCATNVCESCTKSIHSIKVFQSHTVVPLSDKTNWSCLEHSDEKLKYWCTQCQTLVCRDCLLFRHKNHFFMTLIDAATDAKVKLETTGQEINEMKQSLTRFSTTTKSAIDRQREIVRHEKQITEQTFDILQHSLEERKQLLIKQLDDDESKAMKILDRQQNAIDQHLNLTILQELCIKKMLESNDSMQILKFKSTLSHNYEDFIEQYKKIDDGCIILRQTFGKDEKDFDQISERISKLGNIKNKSYIVKKDGITIRTFPLDLSKAIESSIDVIFKEHNIARGYKFSLKHSMRLRSIRIQSDHVGQLIGFVVNDMNVIIQKSTINSIHAMMKWIIIPIECTIKNNYGVFVLPPSDNGSYTYKNGNNQFRVVNENCSIKSKFCNVATNLNVGSQLTIINNTHSINMIIDIEE